ncbi:MAG: chemotaxis protein CheX [Magnetococcales bacterium]|nr:chemotaxis protein CheX [Magnetococcales bacterium]
MVPEESALIAMIVESVREVFLAYYDEEPVVGPSSIKPDAEYYKPPSSEATAIIHYSGGVAGGIHLAAPLYVGLALAGRLAEEEYGSMTREAGDAYGELANIIAGGLQTSLGNRFAFRINLTPPTIITGGDYQMQYKSNFHSLKQFFRCHSGVFFVEFFYIFENSGRS